MADRAIGVRDETDPRVRAIVQALEATAGWETLSHPAGTDSLRELLR
jgi:hypothetical protein